MFMLLFFAISLPFPFLEFRENHDGLQQTDGLTEAGVGVKFTTFDS